MLLIAARNLPMLCQCLDMGRERTRNRESFRRFGGSARRTGAGEGRRALTSAGCEAPCSRDPVPEQRRKRPLFEGFAETAALPPREPGSREKPQSLIT
jgi:hypothetical protein